MGTKLLRTLAVALGAVIARSFELSHVRKVSEIRRPIVRHPTAISSSSGSAYGRGAEIWPECNDETIFRLTDSFPEGFVPVPTTISEEGEKQTSTPSITLTAARVEMAPSLILLVLIFGGYLKVSDVLLVTAISSYLTILHLMARSFRSTRMMTDAPMMPSLPPQGFVPDLLKNPLGRSLTTSMAYDIWLKSGVILSLVAPLLVLAKLSVGTAGTDRLIAANLVSRPLSLLCTQVMSEWLARRMKSPLPLRILIPVLYNAVRLPFLWNWASSASVMPLGRLLAVTNLGYWSINLFGFLLPTAAVRYMRAHFFCVEAEAVAIRKGFEQGVGLLPNI